MALMYSSGSMFLGNSVGTNEQTSLIGSTKFTFASVLASANMVTIEANNDTVLTTEINMVHNTGQINILANNATVLTTSITPALIPADNVVVIRPLNSLLTISITTNLKEPAIKDVTKEMAIIDSTDTYVESRTETEVI